MEKILLLTRSNFNKNKGNAIGILALLLLAATLIGLAFLMFFDAYPVAEREAKRLNAGDGYISVATDLTGIDDSVLAGLIEDQVVRYESHHCLRYDTTSIPFGNGNVAMSIALDNSEAFKKTMNRTEVIISDDSVTSDYVYLPYQFFTSGGFDMGDTLSLEILGKQYSFVVKGFINTTYMGCNNIGIFEFVVDDESYSKIYETDATTNEAIFTCYELKDGAKAGRFSIMVSDKLLAINPNAMIGVISLDETILGKGFMALILAVAFLVLTVILVLVIVLMLSNSIGNYIKENMQIIGALKAVGYTSKDIRFSLLMLFEIISVFGGVLGVACAYALMPVMAKIVVGQMGIPYSAGFCALAVFTPVIFEAVFVLLVAWLATGKIGRIEPIVALRDGTAGHNFKKNHLPLDSSFLNLNVSLAMKTLLGNMKQNVITFFVTGLLVFSCVLGLLMYENFSRNPNLSILTFETCGGVLGVNYNRKAEAEKFLAEREDLSNIRRLINVGLIYKGEERLLAYISEDPSELNNKDICYKGRHPKYDNEVAISGKFAKGNGLDVGDEIELTYGGTSYTYLITGLIQTTNNYGREALLSEAGASHLMNLEYFPGYYWFDCDGKETSQEILDAASAIFGNDTLSTLNFYQVMEGSLTTFKDISAMMLIMIFIISVIVISMILYLFIKALIYTKRKDYGIYKALGYTSKNLIFQTALSFMPAILLGVVCFSFVSFYLANPYMSVVMFSFGLMKCNFTIPVTGIIIIGAALVTIAFLMAVILSARIRKIEPYRMLVGE